MSLSTSGIQLRSRNRVWREAVELLSSMRFSISLLTLICITSVIGTVIKQNEPAVNYVNQLGPFWAEVFQIIGLTQVYSAAWFLLILAFLVLSTSLCIARNAPKILADLHQYKEHLREESLQAFHHRAQGELACSLPETLAHVGKVLGLGGWRAKVQERRNSEGQLLGHMVAARIGAVNKLGYIAAHSAIVLICLGGLLDGDIVVRAQMWWQSKSYFQGGGLLRDVPNAHRLSSETLSFRANIEVPQNMRRSTAVINQPSGIVLQDLPFEIELKRFIVEYYNTGMPKLFASEIVIHDPILGTQTPATVKVNEPAFYRGVAIYQSSFDDGGSLLKLHAFPMQAAGSGFDIEGRVGTQVPLPITGAALTLEFTDLRDINVENFAATQTDSTDVRAVNLVHSVEKYLGSGVKTNAPKTLRNVGPSVRYKLRDSANQAREFHTYMLPVTLGDQRVILSGMRDKPEEEFRYLRIPVDGNDSAETWVQLRQSLLDPQQRALAAERYAQANTDSKYPQLTAQLQQLAIRVLGLFSGSEGRSAGLAALMQHVEQKVPVDERERISQLMLRVLSSCLFDMVSSQRALAKLAPLSGTDSANQAFMTQALLSLSDSMDYAAPVLLLLKDFDKVQASVFQVTRAPGKLVVYLGCICLIIGVFAMLYIRERRMWVWIKPQGVDSHIQIAMSTTRRTLDVDAEFAKLAQGLLQKVTP
jgi:cytochrome c biogenesis protein